MESGVGKERASHEELRKDQGNWRLVSKEMRLILQTGIWILASPSEWKSLGGLYAVTALIHLHFYRIIFIFWRGTGSRRMGMKQSI